MRTEPLPDYDEAARPTWAGPQTRTSDDEWSAGAELVRIHDHLRAQARELIAAIDDFVAGREPARTARSILQELAARQRYSAIGSLCSGYCTLLTLHHSIEDRRVFPGLGRAEPSSLPVLRRLMEEHEVIAGIIERVQEAIDATERDRALAGELRRAVAHLRDRLQSHLAYEEAQLVPALNLHGY